jgi:cholesterol transport system auxiliary component
MKKILAIMAGMCILSACSLLPAPGEPTKKYTLETLPKEPGEGASFHLHRSQQLIVDLPTLYPPLDNTRIALKPEAQTLDYYADVEWADRLSALIQESVIYSLQNKNILRGVSRSAEGINPDYALKIEVRKFYVEPQESTRPATAQVDYMVHLIKTPERHIVASKNFTHAQSIPDQTMTHIIQSLNAAHLEIVKSLAPWIGSHMR